MFCYVEGSKVYGMKEVCLNFYLFLVYDRSHGLFGFGLYFLFLFYFLLLDLLSFLVYILLCFQKYFKSCSILRELPLCS